MFQKKKFIKLFLVLLIIVCSIINTSYAQSFHFRNYSVKDGLPFVQVATIFQDTKGFMWFGTQDGLNRYDGYKFKIFKNTRHPF